MARYYATACFALFLFVGPLWAMPQHKETLGRYFGTYLDSSLRRCATCHVVPAGVSEEEFADSDGEHNVFGIRLRDLADELAESDQPSDLISRLRQIGDEDADGDGAANDLEMLSGTAPGDPASTPTSEQLAAAGKRLEAFRSEYHFDSWKPVTRPEVPQLADTGWQRNPIDAFIAAEHQRHGLAARPEAPRHVLLRRVYLDLVGLPPTPDELQAFLADKSPDAYERVVDQLLERPQYGERWGRHWMDVWRYSDWAGWGEQVRDSMPHVWRWRDWIVESLNSDKPYDRMIIEMLAADELCPEDTDALRATGFLVRNYKRLSREQWMQETVNHTSKAFLAATLECARCHDHMYDPISQEDYYRFRAIFEPYEVRSDRVPGEVNVEKNGLVRAYDAKPDAPTYFYVRGDERQADKDREMKVGVPESLAGPAFEVADITIPQLARIPDKRPFVIEDDLKAAAEAATKARDEADRALQQCSAAEQTAAAPDATEQARAELEKLQHEAQRKELESALKQMQHAALVAVIAVERLEDEGVEPSDPRWQEAARAAVVAQRAVALAEKRSAQFASQETLAVAEKAKTEADAKLAAQPDDAAVKEAATNAAKALEEAQKAKTTADEDVATAQREVAAEPTTEFTRRKLAEYPEKSSGRRLALAKWIGNSQNPRTARVAVNQIWMRHFGQPLVPTVFDFGNNGQPPTHPALLDWLAAEFMQPSLAQSSTDTGRQWQAATGAASPWSMKHLHRLIVTSSAYRMSSTPDESSARVDQDNQYLWRMPPKRMEAELVRDCVLYVAGQLDLTRGGPDIDHEQGLKIKRRSLYFRHAPEKQMTFLRIFDAASPDECYRRKESVIPQQALALANSSLTLEQSRHIARDLNGRYSEDTQFVTAAFAQVLSRPPTAEEITACLEFFAQQQALFAENTERLTSVAADAGDVSRPAAEIALRVRENLVHVLLNHNDFVTIR